MKCVCVQGIDACRGQKIGPDTLKLTPDSPRLKLLVGCESPSMSAGNQIKLSARVLCTLNF